MTSPEPSFTGGLPEDRITVNAEHEIIGAPGFPDLDTGAGGMDDSPIPYTLTPEGDAAASAGDPWADPDYRPRFAPPLTPAAAAAIADDAYGRPPGTSLRLLRGVLSPDPEIAFEEAVMVLDEWDSDDSAAYADRVEAGLEPEAEAEP